MNPKKILLILSIINVVMFIVLVSYAPTVTEKESVDLEIYTLENTYYVNGLRLTDENSTIDYKFSSYEIMKEYLIQVTIEENRAGFRCLEDKRL